MPEYEFKACDITGKVISGSEIAEHSDDLLKRIRNRNLLPIHITEKGKKKKPISVEEYFAKFFPVPKSQLVFFYDQLSALLDSGISVVEALATLEEQVSNKRLALVIRDVIKKVESGIPFHTAMKNHVDLFGMMAVKVIESGDKSGQMELSIAHLAEMFEFELKITNQFKETTRYPKFVITALTLACIVLLTFVLPKFVQLFQKADIDLPWMTQLLILIQFIVINGWGVLLLLCLFFTTVYLLLKKNKNIALAIEKFKLNLPALGTIEQKIEMSRVFRVLSVLLESGVDILTSLRLASQVSRFQIISNAFEQVRKKLEEGDSITNSLKDVPYFPKMSRRMIMLGDKTGKLSETLEKISSIYEYQVTTQLKKLSSKIEPLMIVLIGVMIVIFALGIFLPMWDLIKVLR